LGDDDDLEQGGADRVAGTIVMDQGQDADDDDKSNLPLKALSCLVLIGIVLATATAILGRDPGETIGE
jgi:hypothetical protein